MHVSVIIPVYNQKERLRLTLIGLEEQDFFPGQMEVIVVDDGSVDGIEELFHSTMSSPMLRYIRLEENSGMCRGRPRNVGAAEAKGEVLVFLDADALPCQSLLRSHAAIQGQRSTCGMGNLYCIAQTEWLKDPATGELYEEIDGGVVQWDAEPLCRLKSRLQRPHVTERIIRSRPERMREMACKGPYPWLAQFQSALEEIVGYPKGHPAAFLGVLSHNFSLPRSVFLDLGGFDESLQFKEAWDLGCKIMRAGIPIRFVEGAISYHLYHHHSQKRLKQDRMGMRNAERLLKKRYPGIAFDWVWFFLASINADPFIPPEVRLELVEELDLVLSNSSIAAERRQSLADLFVRHPYFQLSDTN